MLIQILSDIHTEFYHQPATAASVALSLCAPEADALIIAGDLGAPGQKYGCMLEALRVFSQEFEHVLYVPGNHEYYFYSFKQYEEEMARLVETYPNVIPGNFFEGTLGPDGPRVVSCTGWFVEKPDISYRYWTRMMDSRLIGASKAPKKGKPHSVVGWGGPPLTQDTWQGNMPMHDFCVKGEEAAAWLEEEMTPGDIVVTHHLPSWDSVDPPFATDKTNYFYINEKFEKLLRDKKPAYWIHGHTHGSCSYMKNKTHVICNPRGYDDGKSINPNFKPRLVIEV